MPLRELVVRGRSTPLPVIGLTDKDLAQVLAANVSEV
jgi:hypothetical protein